MRIKSLRTGNVVDLENKIGQALIALGDAVDVTPIPPQPNAAPTIKTTSPWAAREISSQPVVGDRSLKTVTTGIGYEREQKLADRTDKLRPKIRNGSINELISVACFCALLGVTPAQIEGMSEERLKHICTSVPKVPDAVSGKEWGQPSYRFEDFMRRGERWIDFLNRIGVPTPTLLGWERAQLTAKCAPISAEHNAGLQSAVELEQRERQAQTIVHVD